MGGFHNQMSDYVADRAFESDALRIYDGTPECTAIFRLPYLVSKESVHVLLPSDLAFNKRIWRSGAQKCGAWHV